MKLEQATPVVEDSKVETSLEFTDEGHAVVNKTQNVDDILRHAAELRSESKRQGWQLNGQSMTYVGTIPDVIVAQWQSEGFYVSSASRSGLNEEEHQRELLKRLQAMPALLTSRHKRLV